MSENKSKKKQFEEIKTDLFASQDVIVENALKKVEKMGDHSFIHPLLHVLMENENENIQDKISKMLSELKVSKAEDELLSALEDEVFIKIHGQILSFIWNSGFQPADHIATITQVAIQGDYMAALEALTLLDNIDGPFQEEHIMESTIELRNYLMENSDSDKKDLLVAMLNLLEGADVD